MKILALNELQVYFSNVQNLAVTDVPNSSMIFGIFSV